ncbi:O-acetylhomoserine aminocarboxypropyltransferase/cysteine synthase family protein [Humibacter sp. RRB41]|uniref:O-acetylhomoserine aminocarboxypropyltransferase/cysteine synthase family protein n=1 Tax=Humibacter sp. RRB41 TaxID=2919946 RepID=UPI001FAA2924|nr:O-acetylhomoserine aminocarboxypropyltransferase/cysteine synthase family protein [Humibacter sp. RRB41]
MTTRDTSDLDFETRQVHAGERYDGEFQPRITPIYLSAGYVFDDFDQAEARFAGDDEGFFYSRSGNPTNSVAEARLASLEGGKAAVLTASGQAATASVLLSLVGAGDHIVSSPSVYEGSKGMMGDALTRLGVTVEFVDDPDDLAEWDARINERTRLLFAETIPNPKNDVLDLEGVAGIAEPHGLPLVIDNTVATPYLVRPLEYGANIVVHSTSKFLTGHATSLGGAVVDGGTFDWSQHADRYPQFQTPFRFGRESWTERYGDTTFAEYTRAKPLAAFGPTASPFSSFLLLQGLETLSLRMERHCENALAVAEWLEQQPEVAYVDYSGLASSRYHERARRYLPRGFGSVFGFCVEGGRDAAREVIDSLGLFTRMTHIGDVRSLAIHPATTTHAKISAEERSSTGIDDGLIRVSIGIESARDLIDDLAQAFDRVGTATTLSA